MAKSEYIYIGPGVAHYPALNRPDTKFDELGQYKANIVLSEEDAAPFVEKLQARAKAHLGKALPAAKNNMFEKVLDDNGEETGEVLFKITVKNKLNKKDGKLWDRKPMLIDAKKKVMEESVSVWGGTVMKVQAEIYEWAMPNGKKGISLQPKVVQILELKTGNGNVDLSGFDEEDGYEANEGVDTSGFDDESVDNSPVDDEDSDY